MYQKLGKFATKYQQVHGVLREWQPKLANMASTVVDLHQIQGELIQRFLAIEGQRPLQHIGALYDKTGAMENTLREWSQFA